MHIIGALLGILIAGAIWWFRLKMLRDASREVYDVVDNVIKAPRRMRFKRNANRHPVEEIDDPRFAAISLLILLAESDGLLSQEEIDKVGYEARTKLQADDASAKEMIAFGRWVAHQAQQRSEMAKRLICKVYELAPEADCDLIEMVDALTDYCQADLYSEI